MKTLIYNEYEKEILIKALNNIIDTGLLKEGENETALLLMMGLEKR